MGLTPVPPHEVATVVTSLEMCAPPKPRPMPDAPLTLVAWQRPALDAYRTLFRRVGAPWLWFSRLTMADERLAAIIHDPNVAVFAAVDRAGVEVGMIELDFRESAQCELSYLALVPELTGRGLGRWLMAQALQRAWRPGVTRVWVHTCTLDHPHALKFYLASGFTAYRRTVETFADPRIGGVLSADCAPHVPLLASRR